MIENNIHPTAIIYPGVVIGKGNTIGPYCIIGAPPEHRDYYGRVEGTVIIGDNNIITGFATIDAGTSGFTKIGNNCFIMKRVHIGHDAIIDNKVTLSVGATIGGHTRVCEGATIGLNATIHQQHLIGAYSMIGMGAIVPLARFVKPFVKYVGNPIECIGKNQIAIDRNNISIWQFANINEEYKKLRSNV